MLFCFEHVLRLLSLSDYSTHSSWEGGRLLYREHPLVAEHAAPAGAAEKEPTRLERHVTLGYA